jgi:hypothetical protein
MPRHTIHLGSAWEAPDPGGAAGWRRRFGRPTGLEPRDRVLLVCDRPAADVPWRRLEFNGVALAPVDVRAARWACDVTAVLRDRNEILLVPEVDDDSRSEAQLRASLPSAWGRISIEIVVPD